MKKRIAFILVLIVLLFTFGCSTTKNNSNNSDELKNNDENIVNKEDGDSNQNNEQLEDNVSDPQNAAENLPEEKPDNTPEDTKDTDIDDTDINNETKANSDNEKDAEDDKNENTANEVKTAVTNPPEETTKEDPKKEEPKKDTKDETKDEVKGETKEPSEKITPFPMMMTYKPNMRDDQNVHKIDESELVEGSEAAKNYGVYIGTDDWYFYQDSIDTFTGTNAFTEPQLKKIANLFVAQRDWLAEEGIEYYLTIFPNKNTIYPEKMPINIEMGETRRIDQIFKYLKENTDLKIIDVRSGLFDAKRNNPDEELFYKLDTHWNNHGGFIAYTEIINTIKKDFPTVKVMQKSDYQIDFGPTYMRDQAWYIGYYETLKQEGPIYTLKTESTVKLDSIKKQRFGIFSYVSTHPDGYEDSNSYSKFSNSAIPDAPSVYMIRDSFAIATIPFFKESFSSFANAWTTEFSKSKILEHKPDIVIRELVESTLTNLMRENFR